MAIQNKIRYLESQDGYILEEPDMIKILEAKIVELSKLHISIE